MKKIFFILMLLPITILAQKQEVFLKLNDASGVQIKGDVVARGFERTISILSFNSAGKNNAQLSFNMNVSGASADLKRAMNSNILLQNAMLTVTQPSMGGAILLYTISMEGLTINNCSETMSCNAAMNTSVVLTAARIGWTYYQQDRIGKITVSRKYGYDNNAGTEWTNF